MALSPFRRFDSFFSWDTFFPIPTEMSSPSDVFAMANTRVDWKETPEAHIFKVDLPGLKKEEVKVQVEDGRLLSIRGERSKGKKLEENHNHHDSHNHTWHRVERWRGSFMRKFRLPQNIKEEEMKAAMENGVLIITIPKESGSEPHKRHVQIA